ncbi:Copper chaperone CopZ [Thiohalospira halophila DSM 15071]|uniref:Copper chaperone CopZ n=1 Tax=Thiohalospira halophila DSM 15071 TaxID=1123397 RepID=A0A1I1QUQ5_9GAMM|nr:heavy-metal-associated domain-containing protein [Thiohalospira halophila]SFD25765.1 Copper chaperone CopZ [Thiohalospira halophila DSM 15071]
MSERFEVDNVKCGGCAAAIRDGLAEVAGVESVEVDIASGQVEVAGSDLDRGELATRLASLGYPERD